jgi:6-phospho-3-hexuloisomerase
VKKDDLVVVVSGSGSTIPAVMTAEIAHNIHAHVVVITGQPHSKITTFADYTILLDAHCEEPQRKQLAPLGTLFEASAWIFLDALIAELMRAKGETEASMQSRHATLE